MHYTSYELVKKSPRQFQKLKTEMQKNSPGIRVLCPTRWTVQSTSLTKSNYEVLQQLWQQLIDVTEMRSRIHGVSVYMKSFNFFSGLLLGEFILKHSDNLSKILQTMATCQYNSLQRKQIQVVRYLETWVVDNERQAPFLCREIFLASALPVS